MTVLGLQLKRLWCALMAALLLLTPNLGAQQGGTITGLVTAARSGLPLPAAQVFISALNAGGLTQQNGRYLLQNVPAGTHTLSVTRIGYRTVEAQVSVGGGQTVVQNFDIAEEALALDEIIVTGTPGGTLRRALGNDVTRLQVEEIVLAGAPPSMDYVLASRTPNLNVVLNSGDVAGGNFMRIRGASSLQLGNQPLLYVDGVRVNSAFSGRTRFPNAPLQSRINDFRPEDIESIEIIKGPSAATLYGTEASAGVIQIITKRGAVGAPVFNAQVQLGSNFLLRPEGKIGDTYSIDRITGVVTTWNFLEQRQLDLDAGLDNDWLRNGLAQNYTANVRGGTDAVRYYAAVSSSEQEGYVAWNFNNVKSGRLNLDLILSDQFELSFSSNLMRSNLRAAQNPRPYSISNHITYAHAGRTGTRGYYIAPPEVDAQIENTMEVDRYTTAVELTHALGAFSQRAIFGFDRTGEVNDEFFPAVPEGASSAELGSHGQGELTRTNLVSENLSAEYSARMRLDLLPGFVGETAVGVQYNQAIVTTDGLTAFNFTAPGLTAVSAAAQRDASGTWIRDRSLGIYAQQQFEWENRRFFTVAVRGDSHSAFGANFDAAIYPKFSGAWVLSEESFWNVPVVNSFRARAAWGRAGRQPATFAAISLYSPETGTSGLPSIAPGTIGNPELGPEVGTEIEVGFDAGLLDDRLALTVTAYNKTTKDALTAVVAPPSTGFLSSQFVNAGEVNNKGIEFSLDAAIIEGGTMRWDVGLNLAFNKNTLVSLGGLPPSTGSRRLVEGFPLGSLWTRKIVSATITGDPYLGKTSDPMCEHADGSVQLCDLTSNAGPDGPAVDELYRGPGDPQWLGAVYSSFSPMDNLRFYANVEFKTDYYISSTIIGATHSSFRNTLAVTGLPQEGILPTYPALWMVDERPRAGRWNAELGIFPGGFARVREISAEYTLPDRLASLMGASRASFTVAGSNLWFLWIQSRRHFDMVIGDPEMGNNNTVQYGTGGGNSVLLTQSRFTGTFRVTF